MMHVWRNRSFPPLIALILGSALAYAFSLSYYYLHVLTSISIFVMFAASINVILGYAGQISIGHAGFCAIGAYACALFVKEAHIPFGLALMAGAFLPFLVGIGLGWTCLRLSGPYLAIVTVAFGWIVQILIVNLSGLTGGAEGLMGLPRPRIFGIDLGSPMAIYLFVLLCTCVIMVFAAMLRDSKIGRSWRLIKEDPLAASVLGVDVTRQKLWAFATSAGIAGFAGGIHAFFAGALFPDYFGLSLSIQMLLAAVIGGLGTAWGPVAGGMVVAGGFEALRAAHSYQSLIIGLIVVLVCIFAPGGIGSLWKSRFLRLETWVDWFHVITLPKKLK
jgi:branched-chain amino acid transport system permease protein